MPSRRTHADFPARSALQTVSDPTGMSIEATLRSARAFSTAFTTAGGLPIAPASPTPFTPRGLVVHGILDQLDLDIRQVRCPRQRIVRETPGQELTGLRVVHCVLQQGLPDTLGDAAMNLPAHDHRVHDPTHVVTNDVTHDVDRTCLGIHLHLGQVAPVREGMHLDRDFLGGVKPGSATPPLLRREGQNVYPQVGPADVERAVQELDVRFGGLELFRGCGFALLYHRLDGGEDRLPLGIQAPRTSSAATRRDQVTIALAYPDTLYRDAKLLGRELNVGGLMPLPGRLRSTRTSTSPGSVNRISARSVGAPMVDST